MMGANSKIEWTDDTHNLWWGCEHAGSPGCDHCYARDQDRHYFGGVHFGKGSRRVFKESHWKHLDKFQRLAAKTGVRRRVFVGSMCDIFEPGRMQDEHRERFFGLVPRYDKLDFLLLSKRVENAASMVPSEWMGRGFPDNVWVGATVENHDAAIARLAALCSLPCHHFISCEPLLGETTVDAYLPGNGLPLSRCVDWIIAGGESGAHGRPTDPRWLLWLRDQARNAGVPFFFKQWGLWLPKSQAWNRTDEGPEYWFSPRGKLWRYDGKLPRSTRAHGETFYAVGKKRAGDYLAGRRYHEVPKQLCRRAA